MRRASALKRIADSTVSAWRAEARQVTQAPASEVPKLGFLTPAQPGTVNDFGHHVFIRGIPKREGAAHPAWSDIVEREEPIVQAFKAVAKHRAGIEGVVRVSAFDTTTPTPQQENSCEVLIFPAGARFDGVPVSKVEEAVSLHITSDPAENTDPILSELEEDISDQLFLFVCCHGSRDNRCGALGPPLCAALQQQIVKQSLQEKVHVRMCSHIGGHKYAGNVLVYGGRSPADGDWYGGLRAENAEQFLDAVLNLPLGSSGGVSSEVLRPYWRGALGMSKQEQTEWFESRGHNEDAAVVDSDSDDDVTSDGSSEDDTSASDAADTSSGTSEGSSDEEATPVRASNKSSDTELCSCMR